MKPTQKQIKEFWELCGCKGNVLAYLGNCSLTLDNLFKYAVEKVRIKVGDIEFANLMRRWLRELLLGKDPTLALFWVIYKVIKDS